MNEQWRQADAEAHEAKAEALEVASAQIEGVMDVVSKPTSQLIGQLLIALSHEADAHRQAAALAGVR